MTASAMHPSELSLYHRNPRVGDTAAIAGSLRANGQYKPIVVNTGTHTGRPHEVLAGNHTLKAIRDLAEQYPSDDRWQSVLVHAVDVDDDRAARIVAADNRTSELGTMDDDVLLELLEGIGDDLDGTGYSDEDLAAILAMSEEPSRGEWEAGLTGLPDEEPKHFTRTFTLTFDQAAIIDAAIDAALAEIGSVDGNAAGAALTYLASK